MRAKRARVGMVALLGMILAGVAAVPVDVAATDDPNTIHACKQKHQGMLRVVDDPSQCRPSEEPISWNVQGPAGTALAFAYIENGVLDATRSQNVIGVTRVTPSSGSDIYCFVLAVTPVNAVATGASEGFGTGFSVAATAVVGTIGMSNLIPPCPAGTNAAVLYGSAAVTADSFFVLFN